ncbi:MAG: A/G-specific adenine glycosylase [Holophaga sp.]|nr:A/G-specific adenine glycosylase [Holophaga sp.]
MSWPDSAELLAPIVPWFTAVCRELPWRAQDLDRLHPDPYAVLVSEQMLQQTQVSTVIPYFQRWMNRYPDLGSLAIASSDEIHKSWEGLGYYRRVRNLQSAAQAIVQHNWPRDLKGLMQLPGLGPYTAAAVASIAFQLPEPALDGNAFRVLARILGIASDPKKAGNELRTWLKPALQTHGPSRMTQAVMELGAMVCGSNPKCSECPLAVGCQAHRQGVVQSIPMRATRIKPTEVELWLLAVQFQHHWLVRPPTEKGLLAGLWSWPTLAVETTDDLAAENPHPYGLIHWRSWPSWTQIYSHRREKVQPLALEMAASFECAGCVWEDENSLQALAMGRRDQQLREQLSTSPSKKAEAPPIAGLLNRLIAGS